MILVAIGFLLGLAAGMLAGHFLTLHRRRSALDAVVEAIRSRTLRIHHLPRELP